MSFLDRAKFVPIRLAYNERPFLRLIEGATASSNYTDRVDAVVADPKNPRSTQRKLATQMRQMCAMLSGIVLAMNYEEGRALMEHREFK